jgi:hypothetical protein
MLLTPKKRSNKPQHLNNQPHSKQTIQPNNTGTNAWH